VCPLASCVPPCSYLLLSSVDVRASAYSDDAPLASLGRSAVLNADMDEGIAEAGNPSASSSSSPSDGGEGDGDRGVGQEAAPVFGLAFVVASADTVPTSPDDPPRPAPPTSAEHVNLWDVPRDEAYVC
jgi:hypothetical protein